MRCSPPWGHCSICLAANSNLAQRFGGGIERNAALDRPGVTGSSCSTSGASAVAVASQEIPSKEPSGTVTLGWGQAASTEPQPECTRTALAQRRVSGSATQTLPCTIRGRLLHPSCSHLPQREQTAQTCCMEATSSLHSWSLLLLLPTGSFPRARSWSGASSAGQEALVCTLIGRAEHNGPCTARPAHGNSEQICAIDFCPS